MSIYRYDGKYQSTNIVSRNLQKQRLKYPEFGDNFHSSNVSGTALEQLEQEHYGRTEHYPKTLVVLVGHFPDKMQRLLQLYQDSVNVDTHDCFIVFNGTGFSPKKKSLPHNAIADVRYLSNHGWDLRMYAESVLNYAYDRYFFINDDTFHIVPGWLDAFDQKIQDCDLIGVQGRHFVRTTYYGSKRLLWLAMYVAVVNDLISYNWRRVHRFLRTRAMRHHILNELGARHAYMFEGTNSWLCKSLGFKLGYIPNALAMRDTYCSRAYKCVHQWPEGTALDIVMDADQPITIDYVINAARSKS